MAKRAFGDQMGPNVQKPICRLAVPIIKDRKIADFLKKKCFHFFDLFWGATRVILRFARWWSYFLTGILFDGFGRTRKTKCNVGLMENPYFKKLAELQQIRPYSQV